MTMFSCKITLSRIAFFTLLMLTCIGYAPAQQVQRKVTFGADASWDYNLLGSNSGMGFRSFARSGFSVHGHGYVGLPHKLSLDIGLGYSSKNAMLHWGSIFLPGDIDPSTGLAVSSTLDLRFHYHQIQVPVLLKQQFGREDKGIYVGLGPMVGLNFGMNENVVIVHGTGIVERYNGVALNTNSISLAAQACLGHRFDLSEKLDLGLELYGMASLGRERIAPVTVNTGGLRVQAWF